MAVPGVHAQQVPPAPKPPAPTPPAAAPESRFRWIAGDLHVHVTPPDAAGHSTFTVASVIERSRGLGLDFLVLTPHDSDQSFPPSPETGNQPLYGQELVERLARTALQAPPPPLPDGKPGPAPRPILVVPGWEFTRGWPGHMGLSFFKMEDVAKLQGDLKPEAVVKGGGLAVVNHPFFRPVKMTAIFEKIMARGGLDWSGDWRWKPFFGDGKDPLSWNAIEVWHERSVLVQKMHTSEAERFPDTQMAADAIAAWDRSVREQRRRIVAVGGSDCHGKLPYAMVPMKQVGVGVTAFTLDGLREGLVAGRVTFGKDGGLAASDFAATSDVSGQRADIGGTLRATSEVRLTWSGRATLVEDGVRVGEFEGGTTRKVTPAGSFHTWRIEKPGDAYSNMIHANL